MKKLVLAASAASMMMFSTPSLAFDITSLEGKTIAVKYKVRKLFSGRVKKCRSSQSGYCVGAYKVNSKGHILAWNNRFEYQWHDLNANGTGTLLYLKKDGTPTGKPSKKTTWEIY